METPEGGERSRTTGVTRRRFVKEAAAGIAAAAGLEGILVARRAPAYGQGTRLNILRWVDFVPACDVELKRQAGEAGKALGAEVVLEFINANDLQARITAAVQSGAGPDIIMMLHNWHHLYQSSLVDLTDLGEWQGKDQGGYYAQSEAVARDGKRWLALPHGIVGLQFAYRKSWFDEVGQTTWPKTLDELRQVGMKLKKKGKRSEEHTSELQSRLHLVCRLLLEKKKKNNQKRIDVWDVHGMHDDDKEHTDDDVSDD